MTSVIRSGIEHDLRAIAQPVAAEWKLVESTLREQFREPPPWLDRLFTDRQLFGGKRLRPLLLLLSGAAQGPLRASHRSLGAALEMIHLATLVHDDLIDGASVRRQAPTINEQFGPTNSVLLGDWLYARAFVLASESGSNAAVQVLARSIAAVCDGEIRQHYYQGDFDLALKDYLEMIEGKTGSLCAAACEIGALLSEAAAERAAAMADYGRHLGIAFQIVDDILDLVGSQSQMGKTLGTDLANRRMTAPLIFAAHAENAEVRLRTRQYLMSETVNSVEFVALLEGTGSIQLAWELAHRHSRLAQQAVEDLPDSTVVASLRLLAEFVTQRSY